MDDISRERRSGSLPEQGGTLATKDPYERIGDADRVTDTTVVDESVLARGLAVDADVSRVIVEPDEDGERDGGNEGDRAAADEPSDSRPEPVPVDSGLAPAGSDPAAGSDAAAGPAKAAGSDLAKDEEDAPALSDADEIARVSFALLLTQRDGVSPMRLAEVCGTTQKNICQGLDQLVEILQRDGLPIEVSRTGDKIKLLTRPEVYPYIQRLKGIKRQSQLSPAALETLAVIAYRQPVIRAEIESIRGVKAGPMLRSLLEHKLVKVVGRADVPGRPLQYGTTQDFLERFGLESLKELPSVQEFKAL